MLEFLHRLSDNQLALLGCLGAFGGACLLLTISYHANPENQINRQDSPFPAAEAETKPVQSSESQRRAA